MSEISSVDSEKEQSSSSGTPSDPEKVPGTSSTSGTPSDSEREPSSAESSTFSEG